MESLHLEILDNHRRTILPKLAAFKDVGYLSGGTALALQLGHRVSYDFDVFCEREIPFNFPSRIKRRFFIEETLLNNQDEFTFLARNAVKISFVFYPFDLKEYLVSHPQFPLNILSPLGVALTKAYALNRRNSWRDYLDLFVVLKTGIVSLDKLIEKAREVFGELFNEKLFLAQLVYTDDISAGEIKETQLLSEKVSISDVKLFFQKEIDQYLKTLK